MKSQSIEEGILERIQNQGVGSVVVAADFLDIASRAAIDQSLLRLTRKKKIIRVDRGIYAYPQVSKFLGPIGPAVQDVAEAIARRGAQKILPTGALAANLLGLSEQVPAKVEFLTDGTKCQRRIGNLLVCFKSTTPKNMATADRISGKIIQAFRYLGKENIGDREIEILRQRLLRKERLQLVKDIPYAPGWMAPIFEKIANPTSNSR